MKVKKFKEAEYAQFIETNLDGFGSCIIRYAERWAGMMEQGIESGMKVDEAAELFKDEADTEIITGFMYGCAVNIVSRFWVYGEELRVWHNAKYGHTGTGTVNPALLK